jgi:hypothetical protein
MVTAATTTLLNGYWVSVMDRRTGRSP